MPNSEYWISALEPESASVAPTVRMPLLMGLLSLSSRTVTSTAVRATYRPSLAVMLSRYQSCCSRSSRPLTYTFHSPWTRARPNTPRGTATTPPRGSLSFAAPRYGSLWNRGGLSLTSDTVMVTTVVEDSDLTSPRSEATASKL
ncbi:hypothetical protein EYF80_024390 [Liparis tanakae]|uniref:Uncharacterized protein n=1 Tax=Liparis tanakae TaxID=230148 RepID=A0A4Z2HKB1_9TELE|nr:hypothetical protein EYF80_024390 [Liparis tanakae]